MTKQNTNKNKKNVKPTSSGSMTNIYFRIGIILLAFILYGQSIDYAFTLDDDLFYVKNQTVLQGIKGIPQLFQENSLYGFFRSNNIDDVYRPVTLSSFAIQKELAGISSKAGHSFNIIVYILAGLALFSVLRRMFSEWPVIIPGIISLLFIAHPIHTEVVCNIKSRDEIMSCFFGFMALRSVLMNLDKRTVFSFIGPSLWFLFALFTKESSITFLAIVPLICYFKGEKSIAEIGKRVLPFIVCAGVFLFIRSLIITGNTDFSRSQAIYNALNAAGNLNELYGTRFYILLLFLKQSVFPYPLSYDYSYNQIPIVGIFSAWSIVSIVLHIALLALMIRFIIRRHPMAFGLAFFFITSVITNNFFITIGATFAERFLFVPVTGILIFIFAGLLYLYRNEKSTEKVMKLVKYAGAVMLIIYSGITFARVPAWKNNFTLYQTGVKTAPNSARAHAALASEYRVQAEQSSNLQEKNRLYSIARQEYLRAAEILPKYVEPFYNLGVIEYTLGDTTKAIEYYKKSLEAVPFYRNSMHNIGVIYLYQKQLDSAYVYLNGILTQYPNDYEELINLSYLFLLKKDFQKSRYYAELGIQKDPNTPAHYRNAAAASGNQGDTTAARLYWERFIAMGGKP
jgi:protein O-mannosyl-transferase